MPSNLEASDGDERVLADFLNFLSDTFQAFTKTRNPGRSVFLRIPGQAGHDSEIIPGGIPK